MKVELGDYLGTWGQILQNWTFDCGYEPLNKMTKSNFGYPTAAYTRHRVLGCVV